MQSFAEMLSRYLEQPGTKQSVVAERAGVDPGTITKLKKGQGTTRDTIIRVASALELTRRETDRLLAAAQYLPLSLAEASDDALDLVLGLAALLSDPATLGGERATVQQFLSLFLRLAERAEVTPLAPMEETAPAPLDRH